MKVIVTGGAGFIGSHLVEQLLKVKKVTKIVIIDHFKDGGSKNISSFKKNKKISIYKKDIRNFKSIINLFTDVDIVYHLAAIADIVPSITDPKSYIENNFNGTINVLESMRLKKVKKIIYAASASCYGITKKIPTNENVPLNPEYPYAFSKLVAEDAIKHWSKVYNIKFISLRLFNVYGTRSRTKGAYGAVMGVFLKQKLKNKPFTVVGNGEQKRDFIYVTDVANAFIKAGFSSKTGEIFNVGANSPKSVNQLVKLLDGKKIFIKKRPGEPDITCADIKKIKKMLGWRPKISFETGIKDLIKNISYWKDAPLWTSKKIENATKEWFRYLKK